MHFGSVKGNLFTTLSSQKIDAYPTRLVPQITRPTVRLASGTERYILLVGLSALAYHPTVRVSALRPSRLQDWP